MFTCDIDLVLFDQYHLLKSNYAFYDFNEIQNYTKDRTNCFSKIVFQTFFIYFISICSETLS